MKMSGVVILLHAHDHVWCDRRIPLQDRIAATDLLAELMVRALRMKQVPV